MKNAFKKTIIVICLMFILFGSALSVHFSLADTTTCGPGTVFWPSGNLCIPNTNYVLLAPLPNMAPFFDTTNAGGIGQYLNIMIDVFIGVCAVLAVIMIVMGGIQYMTSELISSKEAGKERIRNAIFGLLLALGAWLILNTINPALLDATLSGIKPVTANYGGPQPNSINPMPVNPTTTAHCRELASGPGSPDALRGTFGDKASAMSKLCNVESGGNAGAVSGTDKGTDGTVFSFGLFQVNLLSNGSIVTGTNGESCSNLFVRSDGSPIVGRNYIVHHPGGLNTYDAKLKPGMQQTYNDCKATLLDPTKNTQIAKTLFDQGSKPPFNDPLFAWNGDKGACGSAWQY